MLNKREFFEEVRETVERKLNERGIPHKIKMQDVLKSNDEKLVGLTFDGNEVQFSPCIYIDQDYERYLEGTSIDTISDGIAMAFNQNPPLTSLDILKDFDSVKDNLIIRVLGKDENKEWLSDKVWEPYGDFAKVCYLQIFDDGETKAAAAVTEPLLKILDKDRETVVKQAEENLSKTEYNLESMSNVMGKLMGIEEETKFNPDDVMFVLTNKDCLHGASMIAREDVLREVGEILRCNYYVLPSSIHECLIVPASTGFSLSKLSDMVIEVNESTVLPNERLSDKVQFYDRSKGVLENAEAHHERAERKRGQER